MRENIAVFPTMTELPTGCPLRVTLTTSETPHLVPTEAQLPSLLGGITRCNAAPAPRPC